MIDGSMLQRAVGASTESTQMTFGDDCFQSAQNRVFFVGVFLSSVVFVVVVVVGIYCLL